jgi:multicomponent K+:H+ antiporter subunit A
LLAWNQHWPGIDARAVFESVVLRLSATARQLVLGLENGSLQRYMLLLVGFATLVAATALADLSVWQGPIPLSPLRTITDAVTAAGMVTLMLTALATAVFHRQRLFALVLMGASGLLVTLQFARFSAPDLALTQLSVEVMAVVILMLALSFLPQHSLRESTTARRTRDIALAVLAGAGVSLLTWAVLTRPYDPIAGFFVENSLTLGGGTNVVNVILVDFRGFDTLGEITVLGIAAVAIYAMTEKLQVWERVAAQPSHHWEPQAHPVFLRVVSRPVLPMALLVAAYIFLRGHNMPGGGFIAGLIAAVALTLQYMANGLMWTHKRRRTTFRPVVASGILLAGLAGVGSWLFGAPFLTSWFTHAHLPLIGEFEIATALIFDLGVFLTVVGGTLLILSNMGKLMTIHGPGRQIG